MFGFFNDGPGSLQCVSNDEIRQVVVLQRHRAKASLSPRPESPGTSGYCLQQLISAWKDSFHFGPAPDV